MHRPHNQDESETQGEKSKYKLYHLAASEYNASRPRAVLQFLSIGMLEISRKYLVDWNDVQSYAW